MVKQYRSWYQFSVVWCTDKLLSPWHSLHGRAEWGISSRYVTAPSPQDVDRQVAKCLRELNTEEVCQWFTNIGLQKCLPFIKGETHSSVSSPSPVAAYLIQIYLYLKSNKLLFSHEVKRKRDREGIKADTCTSINPLQSQYARGLCKCISLTVFNTSCSLCFGLKYSVFPSAAFRRF